MKILCIGDSITRGSVGVSYVKMLKAEYGHAEIVNAGVNGDTLNLITRRLMNILKNKPHYDYIVLQAGYNDLILPAFVQKSSLFQFGYHQQIKKAAKPLLNAQDFENFLINTVEEVLLGSNSKLVLTTIGPVNEWQDDPLNRKRLKYNERIRKVAGYYKCMLADTAVIFDKELQDADHGNYFLKSFWNTVLFDPFACLVPRFADRLSSRRKLKFTIDGVHLNSQGAKIFSETISSCISQGH